MLARTRRFLVLTIVGVLCGPAIGRADDDWRLVFRAAAEDVARTIKSQEASRIVLPEFEGPKSQKFSSGPGIHLQLRKELKQLGIQVETEPFKNGMALQVAFEVKQVADKVDRSQGRAALDFSFTFKKEKQPIDIFNKMVTDSEAFSLITGLCADRQSQLGSEGDLLLLEEYHNPKVHLQGAKVLAGPKSPFAMEVLVNDNCLAPVDRNGLAFVPILKDQTYTVRLTNDTDQEMAVRLYIDGLSMFTFSAMRQTSGSGKDEPRYEMLLMPPRRSIVVPGWHKTNSESNKFQVRDYPQSAAASVRKDSADVGTITATFAAAWAGDARPKDEPPGTKDPKRGTGVGEAVDVKYKALPRKVGVQRATVSVRYQLDS